VLNGSYPISRPLFLYTDGVPAGLTKKFVDFTLSKEGQDLIAAYKIGGSQLFFPMARP